MAPFVRISIHQEPVVVDEMLMPITVENRIGTSFPLLHFGRREIYMRIHIFYPAICHNAIEMVPGIMRNHARGRRSHQLMLLEVIDHQAGMTRLPYTNDAKTPRNDCRKRTLYELQSAFCHPSKAHAQILIFAVC